MHYALIRHGHIQYTILHLTHFSTSVLSFMELESSTGRCKGESLDCSKLILTLSKFLKEGKF